MKSGALVTIAALAWTLSLSGQDAQDVVKRGEEIYNVNCATAYCHGPKGGFAGAPRLAARGFEAEFLNATIRGGIAGTAMTGFAGKLPPSDLAAVVGYVASLNGIGTSSARGGGPGAGNERPQPPRLLAAGAARGRELFFDAVRGVDRCSTCHEVDGFGIPIAGAITSIPADVRALRALAAPHVKTATLPDDTMPALVVSNGSRGVIFYDLTARPPVLRTADQSAVKLTDGSTWRHSSALAAYNDDALESILAFLRAVGTP
jgi:mono/diheme cytochrome c family protein